MTFIWFVVWLIANNVGAHEPLTLAPVNAWMATLILAIALDLGAGHARGGATRRTPPSGCAPACSQPSPPGCARQAAHVPASVTREQLRR
jgi:hypothetical protein